MLLSIVVVYLLVQESAACRSKPDCPSLPTLTSEQTDTLFKLSQELELLSYQELQERVYSTTKPPIQLSDKQQMDLNNYFPETFKKKEKQNSTLTATDEPNDINSTDISVCSFKPDIKTYNLALAKNGSAVQVVQLIKYDLSQSFEERMCTTPECVPPVSCKCKTELSNVGKAVVTFIGKKSTFHIIDIKLYSCSAYIDTP